MTLTTNGKNYIAQKFGISNCFVATGLSWSYLGVDGVTYNDSGGTAQIVSNLVMSSIVQSVTINSVTYTYSTLKTNNDNTDISLTDALWIAQNDGTPTGEVQYCATVACNTPAITISIT